VILASILMTGGSGRLGKELQGHLPLLCPSRQELDITDIASIRQAISFYQPELIIHAAAYTHVAQAEVEREKCWQVNVEGTRNLVKVALEHQLKVIHISTDYVFFGDVGYYKETDPPGPVRNYYALSKLVSEEIVRMVPQHLIIRTSFRPKEWPYPAAFDDLYTSQDYVDIIALELVLAIRHHEKIPYHTLHIATERKSVYDLASRRKPDVIRGSKASVNVSLPDDISLDSSRWQAFKKSLKERT
jgi:dTDP-4-dehydrorhamnose reductase